ncbi:CDK5 and ABL1 enzyme substrate 2 [Ursus maritimus]|uniref:CDK5 and ABL1 enzyme substrate 2 n=1 Tax=Ursus maritimus TaxID=29073 RepID=A0A8M1GQB0_URSMA|nr:CDK5 and ABL1 enzyme substrate 2 [Ursus maritimus]
MGGVRGRVRAGGAAAAGGRRAQSEDGRGRGGWSPGPGPRLRSRPHQGPAACRLRPCRARAPPQVLRRRGDSRRRQAALFLNNISLDGRPRSLGPGGEKPLPPPPPPPRRGLRAASACRRRRRRDPGASAPQGLLSPASGPAPASLGLGLGHGLEGQRQRRRVASQRCSLEFLEDAVGCASVQRTKHISGSPRHKGLKKTHFIKNMRQYDTRNSRIVLICAKRSLCAAFSVLPYGEGLRVSDLRVDSQKQRHPSGGVSVSSEMVFELEGVELGADGKVVSYAKFLYPTNALVTHKTDSHGLLPQPRPSVPRTLPGSRYKPAPAKSAPAGTELGSDAGDALEYNPNLLDDPQWPCGKHKRVLIFASYMTTVIEYVKPSDLKKDMNETFREKFPHVKLTLSKIRSLKREMRNLSEECSLEPVTVSMAYVYFEKLVLQGKLNKHNRKLCAGACVLLAAKISSDLRRSEVKQLIDKLEERFRFNRRDLIGFEFTVLVALELALYLPESQVLPHYRRLTQQF